MKKVNVPELSESVSEAVLLEWQKQPGDYVREGEVIVSVETDKIVMEVYAPCDGAFSAVHKKAGEQVTAGELLAEIDEKAKAPAAAAPAESKEPKESKESKPASSSSSPAGSPSAMPAAKKHAADQGVDLRQVAGSGKGGRITKGDVLAAPGTEPSGHELHEFC